MVGKREADKFKSIPLSDNTIQRRMSDMAADIRDQLIEKIKKSTHIALQFDESTDISGCAQFWPLYGTKQTNALRKKFYFAKHFPRTLSVRLRMKCLEKVLVISTSLGQNALPFAGKALRP